MNFLNKIKSNYYSNLIDDQIKQKNYQTLKDELKKLNSNNSILYQEIFKKYLHLFIQQKEFLDFFQNNINWLISYDVEDLEYICNFLKFYFAKQKKNIFKLDNFTDRINDLEILNKNFNDLDFNFIVNNTYKLQYQISQDLPEINKILITSSAFFETNDSTIAFTNSLLTKSYVYIVRNPFDLFKKYLSKFKNKNIAMHHLFNYENTIFNIEKDIQGANKKRLIAENRQNWRTNVKSWDDFNVKSTFNGLIIKYENLTQDTREVLQDIIIHFLGFESQSDIEHSLIDEFLINNKLHESEHSNDLSNQDRKIIEREFAYYCDHFKYN